MGLDKSQYYTLQIVTMLYKVVAALPPSCYICYSGGYLNKVGTETRGKVAHEDRR